MVSSVREITVQVINRPFQCVGILHDENVISKKKNVIRDFRIAIITCLLKICHLLTEKF